MSRSMRQAGQPWNGSDLTSTGSPTAVDALWNEDCLESRQLIGPDRRPGSELSSELVLG